MLKHQVNYMVNIHILYANYHNDTLSTEYIGIYEL